MGFLKRLSLTLVSAFIGWMTGSVVWLGVGLIQGSAQDERIWLYNTGSMTLASWLLFGIPVAALDERRSALRRWWTAGLAGGVWGMVAVAVYMHWLLRYPLPPGGVAWPFLIKIHLTAFTIGFVTMCIYYTAGKREQIGVHSRPRSSAAGETWREL